MVRPGYNLSLRLYPVGSCANNNNEIKPRKNLNSEDHGLSLPERAEQGAWHQEWPKRGPFPQRATEGGGALNC